MRELMIVEIRKNLRLFDKEQIIELMCREMMNDMSENDLIGFAGMLYEGFISLYEAKEIRLV
tara:strand:+ start:1815 stop:2000 length:186 start_codon:yes stop_codon:yes gene_type:complete